MSDLEYLASHVGQLVDGWRERIEYTVTVAGRQEARAKSIKQDPLIDQLRYAVTARRAARQEERSAGVQESPHPGNLDASDLLWRIETEARGARQELLRSLGQRERRRPVPVATVLRSLVTLASEAQAEREVADLLRGHVRSGRLILGYDQPMRMLKATVCGDCSGALIVAADASSDVRCIGTPAEPPCGRVYYRWQWIELAETVAA